MCMLVMAVSVLMPAKAVRASDIGTVRVYRVIQETDPSQQKVRNDNAIKNGSYIDFPANVKFIFVRSSWLNKAGNNYVCNCLMFLFKGSATSHISMQSYSLKVGDDIAYQLAFLFLPPATDGALMLLRISLSTSSSVTLPTLAFVLSTILCFATSMKSSVISDGST